MAEQNNASNIEEEKKDEIDEEKNGGKSKAPETVTISKDDLDDLMARLKRVEAASDKSRIARYDDAHRDKMGKEIRLRTIDGKVVISWSNMLTNLVEKDPNGRWKEDQKIEVTYENGKKEEMDLVIFNRRFVHLLAEVSEESKNKDGEVIFTVTTEDGREYKINNKFIN